MSSAIISAAIGICSVATSNASTGADILKKIWIAPIPVSAKVAIFGGLAIAAVVVVSIAESE